jgi:hypothetical protein
LTWPGFQLQLSTAQVRTQKKLHRTSGPVENIALTTKGLQKNTTIEWEDGGKRSNKNELILTEIFPSVHET